MSNHQDNDDCAVDSQPVDDARVGEEGWNYGALFAALIIGFLLQVLLLPCPSPYSQATMQFAFYMDGVILLRVLLSLILKEKGQFWKFWVVLLLTSPFWILIVTGIIELAVG